MLASRVPAGNATLRRYLPVSRPLANGKNGSRPRPSLRIAGISSGSGLRNTSEYSSWQETNAFSPQVFAVHCASITCQAGKLEQPM